MSSNYLVTLLILFLLNENDWEVVFVGNFISGRLYVINGVDVIFLSNSLSYDC